MFTTLGFISGVTASVAVWAWSNRGELLTLVAMRLEHRLPARGSAAPVLHSAPPARKRKPAKRSKPATANVELVDLEKLAS